MSDVTGSQLFIGNFICQGNKWNLRKRNADWTDHPDSLENYIKLFFLLWTQNTASQSAVIISSHILKTQTNGTPMPLGQSGVRIQSQVRGTLKGCMSWKSPEVLHWPPMTEFRQIRAPSKGISISSYSSNHKNILHVQIYSEAFGLQSLKQPKWPMASA